MGFRNHELGMCECVWTVYLCLNDPTLPPRPHSMGFSDTMGAFIAGVLLSETNYKTQVCLGGAGGAALRPPTRCRYVSYS